VNSPDSTEAVPSVSDSGAGLSIEEVRAILHREAGVSIDKDDPLCLLVPILNAYMGAFDRFAAKHRDGFSVYLNSEGLKFLDQARQAADTLTKGVSQSSVSEIKEIFQGFNRSLLNFQSNIRWLTIIVVVVSVANVLAVILSNFVRH